MMIPPFQLTDTPLLPGVTLLEASAGTGKTFTIAGLFLRLLVEEKLTVGEILVVTFTDAATAELRGRIRDRLAQARRALRTGRSVDGLERRFLAGSTEERRERQALIEAALEQFDDAAVFTIHGFCQRVLQERAFESRALFDAELAPDLTPLLRETADNFWRRHFYEAPLRHVGYARHAGLSAGELFQLLRQHTQQAQVIVLARATERPWAAVLADVDAAFESAAALWRAGRPTITAFFGEAARGWGKSPYTSAAKMAERFRLLDALFAEGSSDVNGLAAVADFRPTRFAKFQCAKPTRPRPDHPFFDACERLMEALEIFGARLKFEFLTTAHAELARLKDRERRFGFDDLLSRVAGTLAGPDGTALATALRRRHRAALIDEFQDTDPVQWSIFARVFANADSFLYLVGDPKQAIYSFRGADVFAYLRARRAADRAFTLGDNWRSERPLVAAVNRLFTGNPRAFAVPEIEFHPVTAQGAADDAPLTDAGIRPPPLCLWFWDAPADGARNLARQQQRLAGAVAEEIVRLLSGEVRLGGHRVAPGDVAVLVDTHHEAELVAAELAARRVPSVQRTQQSVFGTREAEEVQALLEALTGGAREGQRRAALATSLMGVDAAALDAWRANDAGWDRWLDRFASWSAQWEREGFLPLFETVLRAQHTRARLLATADGERRLTNFLHLGELLQQAAAEARLSPRALVTWLAEQRGDAHGGGTASRESLLRLERDAAAVQLVTLHSSKGLEYPIVFCPFLTRKPDRDSAPVLFHDPADALALKQDVGSIEREEHRRRTVGEAFAENLRLLYVALTRAQHRCYVAWGTLRNGDTAALAWLLHPPPGAASITLEEAPERLAEHLESLGAEARWEQIATLAGDEIAVSALPPPGLTRWQPPESAATPAAAREFRGVIRRDWGMASFSGLAHIHTHAPGQGRSDDPADRDAVDPPTGLATAAPDDTIRSTDPLPGFRGTRAGTCLHDVFEHLDFTVADASTVRTLVDDRLQAHGFDPAILGGELAALVGRVLDAELLPGSTLRAVPASACWRELEFLLPLERLTPATLRDAFAAVPREAPWTELTDSLGRLGFADIAGFLSGFIDLVFRFDDRWWLVDWKSNWLGDTPDAYDPGAVQREMTGQFYTLQYHLYLLALHRLLQARLPDYDYDRDVGGALYVFVRGVTPGRPDLGLFRDRPPRALIEELDRRLLGAPATGRDVETETADRSQ